MDMMGKVLQEQYQIIEELGVGGMGIVYLARDMHSGADVAVKVLPPALARDPQYLARFEREARALRDLNHPNIVPFIANFMEESNYYLVMEYMPGGSLHDLLQKEGALRLDQARHIAMDISDALIRAHRLDIIHRDLKPENILFDAEGAPRLADFGVAGFALGEETKLTGTGMQVGTPYYMSPEAWQGHRLDAQSDIWSLGILLYEMLSGELPFRGKTAILIMREVLLKPTPDIRQSLPQVPHGIYEIIRKALAKDKAQRYQSMREVGSDLERGEPAVPLRGSGLKARKSRRGGLAVVSVATVLVLISAVAVFLLLPGDDDGELAALPTSIWTPTSVTLTPTSSQIVTLSSREIAQATLDQDSTIVAEFTAIAAENQQTAEAALSATAAAWTDTPTVTPSLTPSATLSPIELAEQSVNFNDEWRPQIDEFVGVEMALVPAGCFLMGSKTGGESELPIHEQCFDQPFWIDRYEVTNEQFGSVGCEEFSSEPDQPRNCVSWSDAASYCESRAARLPTEAEWEYAARGPNSLFYPWGTNFNADNVVFGGNANGRVAIVGSKPTGVSWVGALDMSGNVWEWVSTIYD